MIAVDRGVEIIRNAELEVEDAAKLILGVGLGDLFLNLTLELHEILSKYHLPYGADVGGRVVEAFIGAAAASFFSMGIEPFRKVVRSPDVDPEIAKATFIVAGDFLA